MRETLPPTATADEDRAPAHPPRMPPSTPTPSAAAEGDGETKGDVMNITKTHETAPPPGTCTYVIGDHTYIDCDPTTFAVALAANRDAKPN